MTISNYKCNPTDNLVYLTKVFYDDQENSSPILTALATTATDFTQQLSVTQDICSIPSPINVPAPNCGCGCGNLQSQQTPQPVSVNCSCGCCGSIVLSDTTNFEITNSFVVVRSFALSTAAPLTAAGVTVEGLPITALTTTGGQYIGDISGIMPEITKCPCQSPCYQNCPGNFVLITAAGPWLLAATIVVEGTVNDTGTSCRFRYCFDTVDATPITVTGGATFAFCGTNIPCQVSGVSPSLVFDFDACVKLLNPEISVTCTDDGCTAALTGSLVVTPQAKLQVTRPSLFNIGACEVMQACDDLGQCNPCNANNAPCFDLEEACCCGDEPNYNAGYDSLLNQSQQYQNQNDGRDCGCGCAGGNSVSQPAGYGRAHQCCDTNSYGF